MDKLVLVPREPTEAMLDAGWQLADPPVFRWDIGEIYRGMIAAAPPALCPDSIVAAVQSDLSTRSARGLAKYGTTLDRTDLTTADWDNHLYEELLDAALYMKRRMTGGLCQRTLEAAAKVAEAHATFSKEAIAAADGFTLIQNSHGVHGSTLARSIAEAILALGKDDR